MKNSIRDLWIIVFASIVLGLSFSYMHKDWRVALIFSGIFLLIISINIIAKKLFGYYVETNVNLNFWSMHQYGLSERSHFLKPVSMVWLPLLSSLVSFANFIWMPIIEFDVLPKPERVSRRHGLYRYTLVTEWHMALIAVVGIFANIIFGVAGYILGFEVFAKWSMFYAAWSILPIGRLDGAKIFFGSRKLWFLLLIILTITLAWGITII